MLNLPQTIEGALEMPNTPRLASGQIRRSFQLGTPTAQRLSKRNSLVVNEDDNRNPAFSGSFFKRSGTMNSVSSYRKTSLSEASNFDE